MKFEDKSLIVAVPLEQIRVGQRARAISEAGLALIQHSVEQDGFIREPISLRKVKAGQYELIDGGHRFEVAKRLGHATIDARIFLGTQEEARVIEASANLALSHMPPLEFAVSLAEHNRAYLKLHPTAAQGLAGAMARHGLQGADPSLASLLADMLGVSKRQMQRVISAGNALTSEEVSALRAAPRRVAMDDLYCIAKIKEPDDRQRVVAKLAFNQAKSASAALRAVMAETGDPVPPKDPVQEAFNALLSMWKRTPMAAKRRFMAERADELTALQAGQDFTDDEGAAEE